MLYKYTSFPPKVKPRDKNPAALYKIGASQGLLFVHPAAECRRRSCSAEARALGQGCVDAALLHQLRVRAALQDALLADDDDLVGVLDGG